MYYTPHGVVQVFSRYNSYTTSHQNSNKVKQKRAISRLNSTPETYSCTKNKIVYNIKLQSRKQYEFSNPGFSTASPLFK